jgi:hypothetical protein
VYIYSKDLEIQWAAIAQETFQFPKDHLQYIELLGYVDTPTGKVQCCDPRIRHFFAKGCDPDVKTDTELSRMGEMLENGKPEYTLKLWGGHQKFTQFLNDMAKQAKEMGLKFKYKGRSSQKFAYFGPTQDAQKMEQLEECFYKLKSHYQKHISKSFVCGSSVENSHCVYDLMCEKNFGE